MLLFNAIGSIIPIRYLFGSLMCLQLLLGPVLAYNGLDEFQTGYYKMQIPEYTYFMYVLPAVILFIVGLHIRAGEFEGECIDKVKLSLFVNENKNVSFIFIIVGFVSTIVSSYFSSDLAFVFYLLGGFKFIGVFLLFFSNQKLKPLYLIIVYASIIISSIASAMFHDLLIWLIFLSTIYALRYKPSKWLKLIFSFIFLILAVSIQLIKSDYRKSTWKEGNEAGFETLEKTINKKQRKNTLFDINQLAKSNLRINQGAIITNIMRNVPENLAFSNGAELFEIIEAAILPRIIAPHKLEAGDRDFFMKWSGMVISTNTSMGLSSVGDGYVNFGVIGGIIFMFFYGMLFSEILKLFAKYSKNYPLLILFTCLVFYYPIRPDCELQTILGHLFKSCFLLFIIFKIWNRKLRFTNN